MVSFEIRKLSEPDAPEWWRLRLEALETEPRAFSSAAADHRLTTVAEVARRIASPDPGSFILGASQQGALAGMAGFHREPEVKSHHKGRVWGVYVTPLSRGGGMGRALLRRLLDEARAQPGLRQIMLTVTAEQVAARRLYESLGFTAFGREPRALLVDGKFLDEDYYVLILG